MDLLLKGICASPVEWTTMMVQALASVSLVYQNMLVHYGQFRGFADTPGDSAWLGPNQVGVLGNTPTNKPETLILQSNRKKKQTSSNFQFVLLSSLDGLVGR